MSAEEKILAGVIGAAHGIKGEVKVGVKLEDPEIIQKEGVLYTKEGTPFFVENLRHTAKGVLVKFKNAPDRNTAESLKGVELYLQVASLPPLKENEAYYKDLIGLGVLAPDGSKAGTVTEVFYSGAQDVLVIFDRGHEVLIPYTNDTVGEVNIAENNLSLKEDALLFYDLQAAD